MTKRLEMILAWFIVAPLLLLALALLALGVVTEFFERHIYAR